MTNPFKKIGLTGAVAQFQENVRQAFTLVCDKIIPIIDAGTEEAQSEADRISALVPPNDDIYEVYHPALINTNTTFLHLNNVPSGTYDVMIGAQYFLQYADTNCVFIPYLNGVAMKTPGSTSATIYLGFRNTSLTSGDTQYFLGFQTTHRIDFPLEVNTFHIASQMTGSSYANLPRLVLKKINKPVTTITTEWN